MQIHTIIKIRNKLYSVTVVKAPEETKQGLKGVKSFPENEGMLFDFTELDLLLIPFTMEGMSIPIDIIYINEYQEVIDVKEDCRPGDTNIINDTSNMDRWDYVAYVLEVNPHSGILEGDDMDFVEEEEAPDADAVMFVLDKEGNSQAPLWGGERVFRRPFTRQLIAYCKKAEGYKKKGEMERYESTCKSIGRKMFKEIHWLDNRDPEYVPEKDMPKSDK